jgi:GNAT superfamily N-acetyltransferase
MQLYFTILDETTKTDEFNCKDMALNSFLKDLSLLFQKRYFGVTIVCLEVATGKLIGYYTLCPASIQRDLLPQKAMTGPRPNPIPGFRICRLAVDAEYQGRGIGKRLLVHALKKCLDQAKQIGGSIIIIDAKHQKAKQFYEHFGFMALVDTPLVLIQTIKQVEQNFFEATSS